MLTTVEACWPIASLCQPLPLEGLLSLAFLIQCWDPLWPQQTVTQPQQLSGRPRLSRSVPQLCLQEPEPRWMLFSRFSEPRHNQSGQEQRHSICTICVVLCLSHPVMFLRGQKWSPQSCCCWNRAKHLSPASGLCDGRVTSPRCSVTLTRSLLKSLSQLAAVNMIVHPPATRHCVNTGEGTHSLSFTTAVSSRATMVVCFMNSPDTSPHSPALLYRPTGKAVKELQQSGSIYLAL